MNVLVYSGCTTVTPRASRELHSALKKILSGSYDVKLANAHLLNDQPWQEHTSLVVFPSLDSSEHDGLVGKTRQALRQWVGRGGRYLGIGTGAGFAGSQQLGLLDLTWNPVQSPTVSTCIPSDIQVASPQHDGQPSPTISIDITQPTFGTSFPAQDDQTIIVWARYEKSDDNQDQIAGLCTRHQKGYAALVGFDLSSDPKRLIEVLGLIGLKGAVSEFATEKPSALYLVSSLSPESTHETHRSILERCSGPEQTFQDAQDSFSVFSDVGLQSETSPTNDTLQLFLCLYTTLPQSVLPPIFSWRLYFSSIEAVSPIGTTILFAERVTSTQTLLEKNTKLTDLLPNGTVSIAKKQTNGRGRGSNHWISTDGSIQFSILLKSKNLGSNVVFVQYLFGLAVIEWIEEFFHGRVLARLKWPNDIYASPTGVKSPDAFRKMGGILVNCSFGGPGGTECKLIVGCGLNNHFAPQPSTASLAELIQAARTTNNDDAGHPDLQHPSTEEILAGIFNTFGRMWTLFEVQGFQPFLSRYIARWLHSDQVIQYEKTGEQLKIIGIDPLYGLLRTRLIRKSDGTLITHEQIVDLQPDSNSFDMLSGLIKSKT